MYIESCLTEPHFSPSFFFPLLLFRHQEYGFRTKLMNQNMKYTLRLMQSLQELHLLLTLQQVNFNGKDFLAAS